MKTELQRFFDELLINPANDRTDIDAAVRAVRRRRRVRAGAVLLSSTAVILGIGAFVGTFTPEPWQTRAAPSNPSASSTESVPLPSTPTGVSRPAVSPSAGLPPSSYIDSYLGMSKAEAIVRAHADGWTTRVIGESGSNDLGFFSNRLSFQVDAGGVIAAASVG